LDVFHPLSTKVRKSDRQDFAYLIVRRPRDADPSRLRQCLQPRGYVHTIAKEVPSANHHVTDVNPDAEVDAPVR
jgi:hypothetical protein